MMGERMEEVAQKEYNQMDYIIQNHYTFRMRRDCEGSESKGRRNARISLSKRKKLIFFVNEKSYSIGKASSRLRIKLSTAKMIVKRYNTHGTFFEPKPLPGRKPNTTITPPSSPIINPQAIKMEQDGVKLEEVREDGCDAVVKTEQGEVRQEREEPSINNSLEIRAQPTVASWSFLVPEYPYFYEGYMIQPYTGFMNPLFLS